MYKYISHSILFPLTFFSSLEILLVNWTPRFVFFFPWMASVWRKTVWCVKETVASTDEEEYWIEMGVGKRIPSEEQQLNNQLSIPSTSGQPAGCPDSPTVQSKKYRRNQSRFIGNDSSTYSFLLYSSLSLSLSLSLFFWSLSLSIPTTKTAMMINSRPNRRNISVDLCLIMCLWSVDRTTTKKTKKSEGNVQTEIQWIQHAILVDIKTRSSYRGRWNQLASRWTSRVYISSSAAASFDWLPFSVCVIETTHSTQQSFSWK